MAVVNDATTMQSRIDAVLAAPIMEWDYSPEIQWQPGDPIWKHPDERTDEVIDFAGPALEMPHGWCASRPEQGGGNCPRYMLEIIGLDDFFTGNDDNGNAMYDTVFGSDDTMDGSDYLVDCEDCMVGIGNEEVHCWNCGERVLMISKMESAKEWTRKQAEINEEMMRRFWGGMDLPVSLIPETRRRDELILVGSSFDGESRMRGLESRLTIVDEWPTWGWNDMTFPNDTATYTAEDARITTMLWENANPVPYVNQLDPYDESLYVGSYQLAVPRNSGLTWFMENYMQLRLAAEQDLRGNFPVREFEVPRISLQDTNPDLYRQGYEQFFESENSNARTQRTRHDGRPGGPGRRQG